MMTYRIFIKGKKTEWTITDKTESSALQAAQALLADEVVSWDIEVIPDYLGACNAEIETLVRDAEEAVEYLEELSGTKGLSEETEATIGCVAPRVRSIRRFLVILQALKTGTLQDH